MPKIGRIFDVIFLTICCLPYLKDGKWLPILTKICIFWQKCVSKNYNSKEKCWTVIEQSKTHVEKFLVVAVVCHTSTFPFTLTKLVLICLHVIISKNLIDVILDLLLRYVIPDRKISMKFHWSWRLQTDCWKSDSVPNIFQRFCLQIGCLFCRTPFFRSANLKSN